MTICPGCKNEIDTSTCCCGDANDHHHSRDHQFVPLGCICHADKGKLCSGIPRIKIVEVEEVRRLKARLAEINLVPLEDIWWMEDGETIDILNHNLDEWKFIGLSNVDFITTGFYKTGFTEAPYVKDDCPSDPSPIEEVVQCFAKHTSYQPIDSEWHCPNCGADHEFFIIQESDGESHNDCDKLHDTDEVGCNKCQKGWTGKALAKLLP